ncbi:alpha-hydroxy-acid oxidizing protein [Oceanobacillus alkalisoli]|uniref:alpha-hydroxy-acid oxidizing protein n=1 Tax=Oceanobacillus alkalisoli TaxID=2925113 RepID=UPI001EF08988|nr:alpha-hydroxy-acid oxidizing protein [Oceanobacillus alkalisoli]MCF3942698.1 alpha-hydroxy-acid oxidizing protein [Oceanobacillus alkalisoli]MCG5102670.1 alpha-hydroxy-acid oxidizing protein [Oceanobacillus alkalisoli]
MTTTTKTTDAFIANLEIEEDFPFRVEELEAKAKEKMSKNAFGYTRSGGGGEETLRKNIASFEKYSIVPQYLNDVSNVDTTIELFGHTYRHPFLLAPIGMLKTTHEEAELAVAKAAAKLDVPYIQSTVSSYSIEEVKEVSGNSPKWFQLYWSNNEAISFNMVKRAEEAGYQAIVLTVDTTMFGWREEDMSNRFSPLKAGYGKANYITDEVFRSTLKQDDEASVVEEILQNIYHPTLSWKHVAELKKRTSLPILLKGILHPTDARLAIESGVDGIIVSNHGGRQLDGVISSIDALPAILEEAGGEVPILIDSGIRRGADVVKALVLGADAVLLGRPYAYGLALGGQAGVEKVLTNFIQQSRSSLALAGASSVKAARNIHIVKD